MLATASLIRPSLIFMRQGVAYEEKSAASFCHQVTAWVPDMFGNFNLVKNHKIDNNSPTTEGEAR